WPCESFPESHGPSALGSRYAHRPRVSVPQKHATASPPAWIVPQRTKELAVYCIGERRRKFTRVSRRTRPSSQGTSVPSLTALTALTGGCDLVVPLGSISPKPHPFCPCVRMVSLAGAEFFIGNP